MTAPISTLGLASNVINAVTSERRSYARRSSEFNPKSLEQFVAKVHKEPSLKKAILDKIAKDGVVSVANQFFELSDQQNKNLSTSKSLNGILDNAVQEALSTGGAIRLKDPDTSLIKPQNAGIHVGVHTGRNGTDIDVSITCPV